MSARPLRLPQQFQWWGLLPTIAGLYALHLVSGVFSALFAGAPALLWLATGLSLLLLPGDPRVTAYMALGAVLGALSAIPLLFMEGLDAGVVMALLSAAIFIVAGRISLTETLVPDVVPEPDDSPRMQAKVALDEAIMGYFLIGARVPGGRAAERMCDAALELNGVFESRGWFDDPRGLHPAPLAPDQVNARSERRLGLDYERLSFDSGFAPDPVLPGAAAWSHHHQNRRAVAWMFRHPGPPRPWLLCIHGYRMGLPLLDFRLFPPQVLHRRYGFNLLMPVLPLHGPRRVGLRSGDHYLDGDLLDLLFAQSQALWDLRRWIAWLRSEEDRARIGVCGVSLGGYNTGLLGGYESGLDFGVAWIPVVDLADALWRVIPPPHRRYFQARGLDEALYRRLLTPISPLSRPSLLAPDRRFVVAATADRIVPAAQPVLLARHWDVDTRWFQGSHMSVGHEREPREALREAARRAGWEPGGDAPT